MLCDIFAGSGKHSLSHHLTIGGNEYFANPRIAVKRPAVDVQNPSVLVLTDELTANDRRRLDGEKCDGTAYVAVARVAK